ncbi:lipoxygenase family protein [Algibacillus agarilyticus]|uniref:lipoxygenase family protein n=1 Tax=Algibacillus agarilyticus TaxID=2234133 RepID=UPI000DD09B22|nr:lipoxygenase family protein [Algibacillus agarilyticus]
MSTIPTLPQHDTPEQQASRQFDISLNRTNYNYMTSYIDDVPLSADLPKEQEFTIDYYAKVLPVAQRIAKNFIAVVKEIIAKEIADDLSINVLNELKEAAEELSNGVDFRHLGNELDALKKVIGFIGKLPKALENLAHLPGDIEKIISGFKDVTEEALREGSTAFLKDTLYDTVSTKEGRDYLAAKSIEDYESLFATLDLPQMLTIPTQDWMTGTDKPCLQDWFFGYIQIGGFNTTNLRGVQITSPVGSEIIALAALKAKMPITDAILQAETGDNTLTLESAIANNRLFAVDYAQLEGAKAIPVHNKERYLAAPIALFYLNPTAPAGYPPLANGVMQPIAIQLSQAFDATDSPIFTPTDAAEANDENGLKWRIAKYFVNVCCAIQHEAVAHLGSCHLTIDPMIVAANRQFAAQHPLMVLLKPHFRFTININNSALHSLIVPGGVVATNVGPAIQDTWDLVSKAHKKWRFDDNSPENIFALRGVDTIENFPFKDDTLLLWQSTQKWVKAYIETYYTSDEDVVNDIELQGWIKEMVSPKLVGIKGMNGLTATGDEDQPYKITNREYLIQVIAQIIYIAGPQHASVNYAQYPLMSYMPSVAGTIYNPAPTKETEIKDENDCIKWYPPVDVSMYTFLFEYLLTGVQYDTFGHYSDNPRQSYFADDRLAEPLCDLHEELSLIEIEIRKRNKKRPMEYPFQLPSQIPNSISI